ncbi:MAG: site-specific DNA-methyltransferase [Candidatus Aminicenantes bacterium]|nr:site-specific DNA-methyltransferase [Candidatus Aminicenantes bacterium]
MEQQALIIIGDSRSMKEINNEYIDLIVTSPPYWHIKDYGIPGQIGYGQSLHDYLRSLYLVWRECFRVLRPGSRLCINVGDQYARAIIYGRYKVIPIHAEIISQCEKIGFDFMGSIIWQKKTTMNTTGGANVMGSFPYPPNGIVELDYEYIHIFKKPGTTKKVSREIKEASKLTKEEWKEYFVGHWAFKGAKQIDHEAMFPDELPRRLIKMFSFVDDNILDPFLGSGTTAKVALQLRRNAFGYEINKNFLEVIKEKLSLTDSLPGLHSNIRIIEREAKEDLTEAIFKDIDYVPSIQDERPQIDPKLFNFKGQRLYKVVEIVDEQTLRLDTGLKVRLLGVKTVKRDETLNYLKNYILGKEIILKINENQSVDSDTVNGYVYLKNKIFINLYLIKSGLAVPDTSLVHKQMEKFLSAVREKTIG